MSDRPVMVLGATSSIARAIAEELAREGHSLYLAGRDLPELWKVASDIQIKYGVEVNVGVFDADDPAQHPAFIENAISRTKGLGGVVVAFGQLGDHAETEKNPQLAQATIVRNYSAAVSILLLIANHLEESRTGFIVAISSVAGDRGRYSNYVYGSAKAGLSAFLSGLRSRMQKVGVPVLTVKPGFVDTAMTFGREGMRKVASPEAVGKAVVRAIKKRKDVVYVPGMWRWIMLVIKLVPERVFKKLKF
jgi:decaprenylphospho-beta-D-erythro-pentofuranosid-2-ulose 2-reductase